ncbi:MAG: YARHG domain-containing protein [Lachnospiraceae bacterium]|nr:YARHG domain-containing protein [Lachnospiraceae bacterium]
MKCNQCGKELSPTAKFCTNCGTAVAQNGESISDNDNSKKVSSGSDIRGNWKDQYTILVIIGIMAIAALGGFLVKKFRSNDETSDANGYVYSESYEDKNEKEYEDVYSESYEEENEKEYEDNGSEEYAENDEYVEEEETEEQNTSEYILPESSNRFLSKADLRGLSAEQCRLARNEIYARHGRKFKDEALQRYFESFDWYDPVIQPDDFKESMLNNYEIANRDLIIEYEMEQGYR